MLKLLKEKNERLEPQTVLTHEICLFTSIQINMWGNSMLYCDCVLIIVEHLIVMVKILWLVLGHYLKGTGLLHLFI